jgi:hypothetical protein
MVAQKVPYNNDLKRNFLIEFLAFLRRSNMGIFEGGVCVSYYFLLSHRIVPTYWRAHLLLPCIIARESSLQLPILLVIIVRWRQDSVAGNYLNDTQSPCSRAFCSFNAYKKEVIDVPKES